MNTNPNLRSTKTARGLRGRLPVQFLALFLGLLSPFLLYWGLESNLDGLAAPAFGLLLLGMMLTLWAA